LDVLIVDDSLSVRRVVANLMKNTGWKPLQAKDGVEALELLAKLDRVPDVMLLDIEMPRMDGFELTARLRDMDLYRKVPIIMLTSRAGEKHRSKAFSLGVTDYLVKPYQDEVLLGTIRRLVAHTKVA
jgi:chemosensory pili system protein ChpA (sensor histidine kinase/response regulator)